MVLSIYQVFIFINDKWSVKYAPNPKSAFGHCVIENKKNWLSRKTTNTKVSPYLKKVNKDSNASLISVPYFSYLCDLSNSSIYSFIYLVSILVFSTKQKVLW